MHACRHAALARTHKLAHSHFSFPLCTLVSTALDHQLVPHSTPRRLTQLVIVCFFVLLCIALPSLSILLGTCLSLSLYLHPSVSVSLSLSPFSVTHSLHRPPSVHWYSTSHGLFSSQPMPTAFAQVMQRTNPQSSILRPTPSPYTLNPKLHIRNDQP